MKGAERRGPYNERERESTKPVVTAWESTLYILKDRKLGFVEVCCEVVNKEVYLHVEIQ